MIDQFTIIKYAYFRRSEILYVMSLKYFLLKGELWNDISEKFWDLHDLYLCRHLFS